MVFGAASVVCVLTLGPCHTPLRSRGCRKPIEKTGSLIERRDPPMRERSGAEVANLPCAREVEYVAPSPHMRSPPPFAPAQATRKQHEAKEQALRQKQSARRRPGAKQPGPPESGESDVSTSGSGPDISLCLGRFGALWRSLPQVWQDVFPLNLPTLSPVQGGKPSGPARPVLLSYD